MNFISKNRFLADKFTNIYPQSIFSVLVLGFCALSGFLPELAAAQSANINSATSPVPTTGQACSSNSGQDNQGSRLISTSVQISTWISEPYLGIQNLVEGLGPYVLAYLNRSPWPYINDRAKLARVPIIRYHDILSQKKGFFDLTSDELEKQFELIKDQGVTPISLDQLMTHLQTGLPLPAKPLLLTFDDGYEGHYQYVYPLLKKYGYPGLFSVYTNDASNNTEKKRVSWEQLREMAANPLVTIASYSVTHPDDLTKVSDEQLQKETVDSKNVLETKLGTRIRYFTYPSGKYDERVARSVYNAGYEMALTMNDADERFAGASKTLLTVSRFNQSKFKDAIAQAWGGPELPHWKMGFDFTSPVQETAMSIDKINLVMVKGGKPITIHANSRYQVKEILARSGTNAVAAVDGGFFSMKYLDSNFMIGPVMSQVTHQFIPGDRNDLPKLAGRPLVLISPSAVRFIPFDPAKHNTLEGLQAEMPEVTDAFVAAAWLVKNGQPQPASTFNGLYGFDVPRFRAFWGINQEQQPQIGVSLESVDSVSLGAALAKTGLQDVVMVDSGQSTSLVYQGQSLVKHVPRPVPHAVALIPPESMINHIDCNVAEKTNNQESRVTLATYKHKRPRNRNFSPK